MLLIMALMRCWLPLFIWRKCLGFFVCVFLCCCCCCCLFILCRALLFHFRFSIVIIRQTHGGTVTLHLQWLCLWVLRERVNSERKRAIVWTNGKRQMIRWFGFYHLSLTFCVRVAISAFFYIYISERNHVTEGQQLHREAIWDNEDKSVFYFLLLFWFLWVVVMVLRAKRFTCIHYFTAFSFAMSENWKRKSTLYS